jgi:hypothetical protein
MARCQACARPVLWLPNSKTGRVAPVDVDPIDGGNVELCTREVDGMGAGERAYRVLTKRELGQGPSMFEPTPDRYTLHFATCPDAAHFRRCGTCHKTPCTCAPTVPDP